MVILLLYIIVVISVTLFLNINFNDYVSQFYHNLTASKIALIICCYVYHYNIDLSIYLSLLILFTD